MNTENRRQFLRGATAVALSSSVSLAATRKMKMCLNTGHIGVKANLQEQIAMAAKYGFEAVDPGVSDLAALSDSAMSRLLDEMAAKKLEFGSVAQSVPVTQPDEKFAEFIKTLTATAQTLQRARMKRFCTWLTPVSEISSFI
ncbi:MAG: hypothetical protein M1541_16070, partial [Acidobacteria bacterium]|nr:hypothetical protein [Acidobacteriota bacterium]